MSLLMRISRLGRVYANEAITSGMKIGVAKPIIVHPSVSRMGEICYGCLGRLEDRRDNFCSTRCRAVSEKSFYEFEVKVDWTKFDNLCIQNGSGFAPFLAKRMICHNMCETCTYSLPLDIFDFLGGWGDKLSPEMDMIMVGNEFDLLMNLVEKALPDSPFKEKQFYFFTKEWYAKVRQRIERYAFPVEIPGIGVAGHAMYSVPSCYKNDKVKPNTKMTWAINAEANIICVRNKNIEIDGALSICRKAKDDDIEKLHVDPFEEIEMAVKNAEEHKRSVTENDESKVCASKSLCWRPPRVDTAKCNINGARDMKLQRAAAAGAFRLLDGHVISAFHDPVAFTDHGTMVSIEKCNAMALLRAVQHSIKLAHKLKKLKITRIIFETNLKLLYEIFNVAREKVEKYAKGYIGSKGRPIKDEVVIIASEIIKLEDLGIKFCCVHIEREKNRVAYYFARQGIENNDSKIYTNKCIGEHPILEALIIRDIIGIPTERRIK